MKLCYYQLLDFRQGVRENLMKGQGVRVHIKVKNHCFKVSHSLLLRAAEPGFTFKENTDELV